MDGNSLIKLAVFILWSAFLITWMVYVWRDKKASKGRTVEAYEERSDYTRNGGPSATYRLLWRLFPNMSERDNDHKIFTGADFIAAVPRGDKVFVMVIVNNQATLLEDELHMFPSDQLITKLRLIM